MQCHKHQAPTCTESDYEESIGFSDYDIARRIIKQCDTQFRSPTPPTFPDFVARPQQSQQWTLHEGQSDDIESDNMTSETKEDQTRQATAMEMTAVIFADLATLPHALLMIFTDMLLPIIPQIGDYSCLICGDLACRPILLDCVHRFCIRCLVKMQKRGQDPCPACRAPVVMKASKGKVAYVSSDGEHWHRTA